MAECQSFSGAARRVSYSESSVLYHVRELEKSLGAPLMRRADNRLEMTDAGRAVVGLARDLLDSADRIIATVTAVARVPAVPTSTPRQRTPLGAADAPPRHAPDHRLVPTSRRGD